MTRPIFGDNIANQLAQLRQRVTRLERRPTGAPAPAAAGGGFDTAFNLLTPHGLNNASIYNGFTFTDNFGVNRYNQFYIEATTDAKHWGRILRLGPSGSLWGFTLVMRKSSDAAKVKVQIASLDDDGTGAGTHPGTGTLTDGEDGSVTYYDLYRIPSTPTLEADLYAAGTTEYEFYGVQWQFQLNGTGSLASTPTLDTSDSLNLLDSGEGMYAIKFLTSGKNASSSSYRARYHYAVLHRMTENLLET